jgi:hypothetical protein
MPYSTVLIEDCDLTRGVDVESGEYQSFTLRNSKAGILKTIGSTALGDILIEGIEEGHVDLSASDFRGKLTVRNCAFYQPYDGYSFRCGGCVPTRTLIENITCAQSPVDVTSTFGPRETWKDPPPNKSFIIRNCQAPHLQVNWAQTRYLRIENCQFSHLDIKDSRIGRLELIGDSLIKLDVSRTQVKEQDVRLQEGDKISGHITITEGSNIKLLPGN